MTSVNADYNAATAAAAANSSNDNSRVMDNMEFINLMITELTNQDPMEPMSNQQIMEQMATLQRIESNEEMSNSFDEMISQLDSFLNRQQMSDATSMIGEMVMGKTPSGMNTYGQVIAVNVYEGEITLELDNGWSVQLDDVTRFGGTNSENMVGSVVMGTTLAGSNAVGTVESVDIGTAGTYLVLDNENHDRIEMASAVALNTENIAGLVGATVKGVQDGDAVQGTIQSVSLEEGNSIALNLSNGKKLALEDLTQIISLAS